jgi:hypothetical protein
MKRGQARLGHKMGKKNDNPLNRDIRLIAQLVAKRLHDEHHVEAV